VKNFPLEHSRSGLYERHLTTVVFSSLRRRRIVSFSTTSDDDTTIVTAGKKCSLRAPKMYPAPKPYTRGKLSVGERFRRCGDREKFRVTDGRSGADAERSIFSQVAGEQFLPAEFSLTGDRIFIGAPIHNGGWAGLRRGCQIGRQIANWATCWLR